MPWNQVLHKFKLGSLKSGAGGPVKNRKQAVAIMLSEKAKAAGNPEYRSPNTSKRKPDPLFGE